MAHNALLSGPVIYAAVIGHCTQVGNRGESSLPDCRVSAHDLYSAGPCVQTSNEFLAAHVTLLQVWYLSSTFGFLR